MKNDPSKNDIPDLNEYIKNEQDILRKTENIQKQHNEFVNEKTTMPIIYDNKKNSRLYLIPIILILSIILVLVTLAVLVYNSK